MNILITITADSVEELEWRSNEMKKLMVSQDLQMKPCYFRQEQAFLSALPLNKMEKELYALSKRNVLTSAECIPASVPHRPYFPQPCGTSLLPTTKTCHM